MKHVLFVLLALPVPVLFAQKPSFDAADLEKIAESEAKAHAGKIVAPSGLAASGDYDVRYHRLEWQVDPAVKYINGKATTYFEAKTNGFGTVQFDLMDSLKVDWVRWHGQPLFFSHHNNILRINLPQPLAKGALDSLTVQYQGRPATTGFGSFVQSAHGDTPIIWTLSEPYGARDWWPCKQDLSDKIDSLDVLVTCPAAYRAAGNGLLVSEKDAGAGKKTYHWRHRYPIACYLVCLAVTNYAVYSDYAELQTGTLPILNYVFPENLVSAQAETPQTIAMLEYLDSLFISYPFHTEKYGHAQFVWGGGMEHQTMSFMGYFGYELTAHELAHQWFGDYITCGSWADIWLNEGFATYLSGLIYERFSPNHDWSGFRKSRIDAVVSQPDGSVWVNDTTVLGRIFNGRLSYAKGAMVLHMLRWSLGDEVFFTSVRNYLNDPALANGFARTADLQDHLEAASGQDLDWFFNDWIYGQGHPSYQIVWHQTGNTVTVQVNQTQSHTSVPFFEVPLPLRFKNGAQYYDARLQPTVSGQVFQLTLPFTVTEVLIDPDLWLISANNTVTQGVVGTEERPATSACLTPNPTTGPLRVSLEHGQIPEYVEVFDAAGKMIRHMENTGAAAVDLDLSALPAGVYEVRIFGGNNSPVVGKVLKW